MTTKWFGLDLLEHMQSMIKSMLNKFKMNIKPIKTKKDYEQALERLELISDAKKGTENGDELEILEMLIENFENEKFPIGFPEPVEAISGQDTP